MKEVPCGAHLLKSIRQRATPAKPTETVARKQKPRQQHRHTQGVFHGCGASGKPDSRTQQCLWSDSQVRYSICPTYIDDRGSAGLVIMRSGCGLVTMRLGL